MYLSTEFHLTKYRYNISRLGSDYLPTTTHAVFPHILISAKCGKRYWIFREKSEKCETGKFEIFNA